MMKILKYKNKEQGARSTGHKAKRMVNIKPYYSLAAFFMACMMTGCSQDMIGTEPVPVPDEPKSQETGIFYFDLGVRPSAGANTRAGELKDGEETGIAAENKIGDVTVILAELIETEAGGSGDYHFPEVGENSTDAKKTFRVLAFTESEEALGNLREEGNYIYITGKVDYSDLENYFKETGRGDLYLMAFANIKNNNLIDRPVIGRNIQRNITALNNDLEDLMKNGNIRASNGSGNFLMSSEFAVKLRKFTWDDVKGHYSADNPFHLMNYDENNTGNDVNYYQTHPITLHRLAARIDIDWKKTKFVFPTAGEDGTPVDGVTRSGNTIIYPSTSVSDLAYSVTIDAVALANVGKDYYLFQETGFVPETLTSNSDGIWNIFGVESGDNKIVRDPKGYSKGSYPTELFNSLNELVYHHKNSDTYIFRKLSDFNYNIANESWKEGAIKNEDYGIFSYTIPNSIHDKTKQRKDNCTAVIYRARIGDNTLVTAAEASGGMNLYAYRNRILGLFETFKANASVNENSFEYLVLSNIYDSYKGKITKRIKDLDDAIADLSRQLEEAERTGNTEAKAAREKDIQDRTSRKEALTQVINSLTGIRALSEPSERDSDAYELFRESVIEGGVRIYTPTNIAGEGVSTPEYVYYCYYYYWIKHNDNGLGNIMGPMEYAIVRNYVYKLSVGKIYDLGYPDDPDDDPDPIIPSDPVEKTELRFEVACHLFPWSLRTDSGVILK